MRARNRPSPCWSLVVAPNWYFGTRQFHYCILFCTTVIGCQYHVFTKDPEEFHGIGELNIIVQDLKQAVPRDAK